jgi:hypothetical protein
MTDVASARYFLRVFLYANVDAGHKTLQRRRAPDGRSAHNDTASARLKGYRGVDQRAG